MKETIIGAVAFVSMLFLAIFFANLVGAQNSGDAGSSLAEQNLAGERDQNLDRVNVNIKGTSATPTPASADRCVIRCDATADALSVSISGGAYEAIAGTGVACQCAAAGANSTAVGVGAAASGDGSIAIGAGVNTNETNSVCIGALAGCNGDESVQIGAAVTGSGTPTDSVCVGHFCQVTGADAIAIGSEAIAVADSIALGAGAVTYAANNMVIGGPTAGITTVTIGSGYRSDSAAAITIRPNSKLSANSNGTALYLEGGAGTGTGNSSGIGFLVPLPGAAGSTVNPGTLMWSIGATGTLLSASGVAITLDGPTVYKPSTQTISAAGNTVTAVRTNNRIDNSSGGTITLTSAPTIAAGTDGQIIIIQNMGANDVVLQDQDTLALSNLQLLSNSNKTIGYLDSIWLMYNLAGGAWYQVHAVNDI